MVSVGLADPLGASESRLSVEKVELLRMCPPLGPGTALAEFGPHGELGTSPRSDRGDPSLLDTRLACEPPHAFDRSRSSADNVI